MFIVDCLKKSHKKIILILICTSSLYNMTLHLVPSTGREHFSTPWFWAVPVTCLDQQSMVELMVMTYKSRPQETFQQLLLPSRSVVLKLPESKSMKDHLTKLSWVKPSRSTSNNSQSTTTSYVSEAISNHTVPVELPVNWSHISDPKWDKKKKEPFSHLQPKLFNHRMVSTKMITVLCH